LVSCRSEIQGTSLPAAIFAKPIAKLIVIIVDIINAA
jgi:hypothetical protein